MNNPFDYTPDPACEEAFRELTENLDNLRKHGDADDIEFCRELESGKMLGVLIAEDPPGVRHTLHAFSGQIGRGGFHYPGFVGPVFDYLAPGGHFKTGEAEISHQNSLIALFEDNELARKRERYEREKSRLDAEIAAFKEKCRKSKSERQEKRERGGLGEEELNAMLIQSQFEKAELKRIKKRAASKLEPYLLDFREAEKRLTEMKRKRRLDSEELQNWLFKNFKVLNGRGERRSLAEIFATTSQGVPPSGAGECCGPKLLQAAFLKGWRPISMAEYWYGKPKDGEVRLHGEHYPACRGKCLPVLTWMLEGVDVQPPLDDLPMSASDFNPEIIYENEWFCVVDKPAGMLSVPGKGSTVSLQQWLERKYGKKKDVRVAHRLDQDTSGLIIACFGNESYKLMQSLFALREIRKSYFALLDGDYEALRLPRQGRIELPLSPDWLDRPRQRVDFKEGKEAVTDYEFIGVKNGGSRVIFHPLTGRTHQLRVHAASVHGLAMPIIGDRLYGRSGHADIRRMCLHAGKLEFIFPLDGRTYHFESPAPF